MSEIEEGIVDEVEDQQYEESPTSDEVDYQADEVEAEDDQAVSDNVRLLRQRVEEQERIIKFMQEQGQQKQPEIQEKALYDDPDDLPTYGTVDQMVDRKMKSLQEQQKKIALAISEQTARSMYPDYDRVSQLGVEVVGQNRAMAQAIMDSDNPAQLLYQFGQANPKYLTAKKGAEASEKVKVNLNKPKTLNQAGGAKPSTRKSYSEMTPSEIRAEAKRVMLGN